ncbi:MAG: serine/threonine protein kinase [Burkholderiaceae bacterium]|nr:serine/threonine protein kinase [Burkholderiaceae bacterium]
MAAGTDHPFDLAPDAWVTLRALLDQALALAPDARTPWLDTLDPRHAPLTPRLRALLAHAQATVLPIDALPGVAATHAVETAQFAPGPRDDTGHAAGERVGPYRLLRPLGAGGMGSVWLAERDDVLQRRRVALKMPRLVTGRAALAERLAREREILATLAHPHIARLYDAGVAADGQPFIALEYVEGERIDAYCERNALDVPARLRLVVQVAQAVAHAHANLVVHRDLKPANILVSSAGDVKLLDFGIAKLLDDGSAQATALTQLAGRVLTPDYAAPEQILGQPIGTAADVYALGVVLFELLAGVRPYRLRRGSRTELEEAIVAVDAPRPSSVAADATLRRRLSGELDTIVLKALKKSPTDRYRSVEAFADDLLRHLSQRPVLAQPDRHGYRLRKFVARHRSAVGAGTAAALALLSATGVALWQAQLARDAQRRADVEMQIARKSERMANAHATLADFMLSDLTQRSGTEVESQITRAAALVRTQHAGDPLVRAHLLASLAGRHRRQSNFAAWRALATEAEAAAREAGDLELGAQLACQRARDAAQSGAPAEASGELRVQIAVLDKLQPTPNGTLVRCLADASAVARLSGDAGLALSTAQRIRDIERAAGIEHSINHAATLMILARAQAMAGRLREAVATTEQGLAIHARSGTESTPGAHNLRAVQAALLREGGQPRAAIAQVDRLLAHHAARGSADASLATLHYERGLALLRAGQAAEAVAPLERSLAAAGQRDDRSTVRAATSALALALATAGQHAPARDTMQRAAALYAPLRAQRAYPARLLLLAQAEVELVIGGAEATTAAAMALDEAESLLRQMGAADDPAWRPLSALRARLALVRRQPAAALARAADARRFATAQAVDPDASAHVGEAWLLAAEAHSALGDAAAAARDASAARRHLQATVDPSHPALLRASELAASAPQ